MSFTILQGIRSANFLMSTFRQLWNKNSDFESNIELKDKVCIVTGGNRGIGMECVKDLVKRGATIVIACRNLEKGYESQAEIEKSTGIVDRIKVMKVDLSSFDSVKEFVAQFRSEYDSLHLLVNNAGMIKTDEYFTPDGNESFITANYLGHFLLTYLLLDLLKKCAPSRVINLSSSYYYCANDMKFDDFHLKNYWVKPSQLYRYARSKLANVMFTKELNDRYQEHGITSYSCHPGVVKSELFDKYHWSSEFFDYLIIRFGSFWMKSTEEGAKSVIYCCVAPDGEIIPGDFYDSTKHVELSSLAKNKEMRTRLWEMTLEMLNLS